MFYIIVRVIQTCVQEKTYVYSDVYVISRYASVSPDLRRARLARGNKIL